MESEYTQAIEFVNECVRNDDREKWWPKIVRIHENNMKTHEINGVQVTSGADTNNAFNDAHSNSIFRLVLDETLPCALYAYPAQLGITTQDIIVGFMGDDNKLQLAWDGVRVHLNIGQCGFTQPVPRDAKWIIGASFNVKYMIAIYRFGKAATTTLLEVKKYTPCVFNETNKV